jgi:hypothetical protein
MPSDLNPTVSANCHARSFPCPGIAGLRFCSSSLFKLRYLATEFGLLMKILVTGATGYDPHGTHRSNVRAIGVAQHRPSSNCSGSPRPAVALTRFVDHRLAAINANGAAIRSEQGCKLAHVVSTATPYVQNSFPRSESQERMTIDFQRPKLICRLV